MYKINTAKYKIASIKTMNNLYVYFTKIFKISQQPDFFSFSLIIILVLMFLL